MSWPCDLRDCQWESVSLVAQFSRMNVSIGGWNNIKKKNIMMDWFTGALKLPACLGYTVVMCCHLVVLWEHNAPANMSFWMENNSIYFLKCSTLTCPRTSSTFWVIARRCTETQFLIVLLTPPSGGGGATPQPCSQRRGVVRRENCYQVSSGHVSANTCCVWSSCLLMAPWHVSLVSREQPPPPTILINNQRRGRKEVVLNVFTWRHLWQRNYVHNLHVR